MFRLPREHARPSLGRSYTNSITSYYPTVTRTSQQTTYAREYMYYIKYVQYRKYYNRASLVRKKTNNTNINEHANDYIIYTICVVRVFLRCYAYM